jgi:hypothetical protein
MNVKCNVNFVDKGDKIRRNFYCGTRCIDPLRLCKQTDVRCYCTEMQLAVVPLLRRRWAVCGRTTVAVASRPRKHKARLINSLNSKYCTLVEPRNDQTLREHVLAACQALIVCMYWLRTCNELRGRTARGAVTRSHKIQWASLTSASSPTDNCKRTQPGRRRGWWNSFTFSHLITWHASVKRQQLGPCRTNACRGRWVRSTNVVFS